MRRAKPEVIDVDVEDLLEILGDARTAPLSSEHYELLKATIETHSWTIAELEKKNASLARIRKELSITTKKTEKTSEVLKGDAEQSPSDTGKKDGEKPENTGGKDGEKSENTGKKPKKKPKGHGRNGADAYKGAEKVEVPHESLKPGDSCPECESGKIYQQTPRRRVRLRGQAPIMATLLELERLRCSLCGKVFTATPPAEAGGKKYDETAVSMIALLKYGSGLPFNRLAGLERNLGIPLPVSTQWDIVEGAAWDVVPTHEELIRTAAQGSVLHHDDTPMKIQALLEENQRNEKTGSKQRTGMFTTGVVSLWEEHQIALFFTGRQHAGENLQDVLEKRTAELDPPIQMCDGSSRNESEAIETFLANCLVHGRRRFVDVATNFPEECRYVLEALGQVYMHDATTREQGMSPEERLRFHQDHSTEIMADLKRWMEDQLAQKKVEPNSSLGGALSYMLKRWDKLTLFLRKAGAPLDNNICERALKKAILHRKNSLFYKTLNGAYVGDIFMSLIHTAELVRVNPFDYLTELQKHTEELRADPRQWMPWNYQATLAALNTAANV
jgi:transposase